MIQFIGYKLYCTYFFKNNSLLAYSLHYSEEESLKHLEKIIKYHNLQGKYVIDSTLDKWLEGELKGGKIAEFVSDRLSCYKNHDVYEYLINVKGTITYSELSKDLGKNMREIIMALKRNPFLILIPCHRVLRKDGNTSEYTPLGTEFKEKLLEYEKIIKKV